MARRREIVRGFLLTRKPHTKCGGCHLIFSLYTVYFYHRTFICEVWGWHGRSHSILGRVVLPSLSCFFSRLLHVPEVSLTELMNLRRTRMKRWEKPRPHFGICRQALLKPNEYFLISVFARTRNFFSWFTACLIIMQISRRDITRFMRCMIFVFLMLRESRSIKNTECSHAHLIRIRLLV